MPKHWEYSIVIGVTAAFAFGVASEGRYGTAALMARYNNIDFIACAFDQITNFAAKSRYRWRRSLGPPSG